MTVRGEWSPAEQDLREALGTSFASEPDFLDALTPDLWLRYGLEMGWVERQTNLALPTAGLYRFTAGAE